MMVQLPNWILRFLGQLLGIILQSKRAITRLLIAIDSSRFCKKRNKTKTLELFMIIQFSKTNLGDGEAWGLKEAVEDIEISFKQFFEGFDD